MSSMNPLSIPGGWSKDKNQSKGSPATEKNNPTEDSSVPRSAAGTVDDAGDIVNESGKSIGKISDSKDPKELAGNTVTAAGDIVSDTGDVLGKATGLDLGGDSNKDDEENASEYTTKGVEEGDDSSGFNVVGKAKGALSSVAGGSQGGSQADIPDTDKAGDVEGQTKDLGDKAKETGENAPSTDDVKETAEDTTDEAKEKTDEVAGDAQDKTAETQDDLEAKTDEAKETTGDVADDAQDKVDETKDDAENKTGEAQEQTQEATGDAQDKVDETKADAEDKTGEAKDKADVEGKTDELKDDAEKTTDDAAEKTDEVTDEAKDDAEKTTDDAAEKTEEVTDEAKDKTDEAQGEAEEAKDQAEEKTGEATDEAKDKVDETTDEAKDKVDETTDEAKDDADVPVDEKTGEKLAGGVVGEEGETKEEGEQQEGQEEAEQKEGEEPTEEDEKPLDYSTLKNSKVNKGGNLVTDKGEVVGKVVEGEVKQLIGKVCDENGDIWDSSGKKAGKGQPYSESELEDMRKEDAPFQNFPDAVVEGDGKVTSDGVQVGVVVEGDPKKLKGSKVDADGDILSKAGNLVGKAEPWNEPEPEEEEPEKEVDNSALAGKRVNKAGNVVDSNGSIYGRVIEGNVKNMIGRMCNAKGEVLSESGDVIGKAELVPEGEREGAKEGPFAELEGLTVAKDGTVVTPSGDIVGRLTSGDPKKLAGRGVDDDGEVTDANGNVLGKAERWEPEAPEEKKKGPLAGRKVTKSGEVHDDDGNVMGKLISGDAVVCAGKECDDDGDVINSKGQSIGHVALLEDIPEPEPEVEEESAEDKAKREEAEKDKKLATQLAYQVEQSLEKIRPICKRINDKIDAEESKPKEDRDEEELVKQVRPLIEEGGRILTEANGVIRGMDPDGRIQRNAKQKAGTREATPEEHHLAEVLKELTGSVTECIDSAKRKLEGMPKAKKQLSPLWGLLSEPLFQILAAVGLLLNGVLGIVGRLLSGLGLGGLVDGLLGSLGLDKILGGLGLGDALGSLTGKKK